ncbi:MAG: class I SAM-dependent methyltransferase [Roseiflexaceae bacterium]
MLPIDKRPRTLRTVFDQAVDDYDAIRPGYPSALIDDIITIAALPANGSILEIGCGTGQATIPFAQRGYQMTCLDIGPALAARAAFNCRSYPNVSIQVAAFEDWPAQLQSFDLVMSATAFHWIPPEIGYPKAAQMLKNSGALAIFSNEHPTPYTDFFADVQQVYQRVVPEWRAPQTGPTIEERIAATAATLNETLLFEPAIVRTYSWSQAYTAEEHIRLLNTYSDHRALATERQTQLFQGIADLIETAYGGTIIKQYLAVLYLAKKG